MARSNQSKKQVNTCIGRLKPNKQRYDEQLYHPGFMTKMAMTFIYESSPGSGGPIFKYSFRAVAKLCLLKSRSRIDLDIIQALST